MTTLDTEQLNNIVKEIVTAGGKVLPHYAPNDVIYEYNITCLKNVFYTETAEIVYKQRKWRNQNWTNKWTPNDN